jgi:hypothetical protein
LAKIEHQKQKRTKHWIRSKMMPSVGLRMP